ncbi:hypothetical protein [Hominenteromicrobium sp.]|uniref:hypothetical protein n=1 Tax=Hominenteromicrobium sp. TaxID=3073581 RepID=UPI003AF1B7AA
MIDKAKCFTDTMRQLALEYNAKPEDFTANQVTVTTPTKPDGVRLYSHALPFFQMASTGSGVVITANEVLHPFLKEFTAIPSASSTRIGCSSFRTCCASNVS